jgi:hypothetical protein
MMMLSIKNNDPKVGGLCTAWAACTPRRVFLLPLVFFPRPDSTLVVQVIEAPAERTYRYGTSFLYRQSSLTVSHLAKESRETSSRLPLGSLRSPFPPFPRNQKTFSAARNFCPKWQPCGAAEDFGTAGAHKAMKLVT